MKVTGQGCAGQANNNLVADLKVICTANDATNVFAAIGRLAALWCNSNLTPANGLAV